MSTLGIAVIFAITITGIVGEQCNIGCVLRFSPIYCGYDETCNFLARNRCHLDYARCMRRENNVTDFIKVTEGECPTDKPLCLKEMAAK